MPKKLLLRQGLLDQHQAEFIQPGEVLRILQGVRRVGVDLEQHRGPEPLPHRPHPFDVEAGLDLELDAAVPLVHVAGDRLEQLLGGVGDADRDAAVHLGAHRSEVLGQRPPRHPQLQVQPGHLQGGLGHPVAPDRFEHASQLGGGDAVSGQQPGQEVLPDHLLGRLGVLGRVARLAHGDALAPTLAVLSEEVDDEDVTVGLDAERGAEGRHQGDGDSEQLHGLDARSGTGLRRSPRGRGGEHGQGHLVISSAQLQPDVAPQLWHL